MTQRRIESRRCAPNTFPVRERISNPEKCGLEATGENPRVSSSSSRARILQIRLESGVIGITSRLHAQRATIPSETHSCLSVSLVPPSPPPLPSFPPVVRNRFAVFHANCSSSARSSCMRVRVNCPRRRVEARARSEDRESWFRALINDRRRDHA